MSLIEEDSFSHASQEKMGCLSPSTQYRKVSPRRPSGLAFSAHEAQNPISASAWSGQTWASHRRHSSAAARCSQISQYVGSLMPRGKRETQNSLPVLQKRSHLPAQMAKEDEKRGERLSGSGHYTVLMDESSPAHSEKRIHTAPRTNVSQDQGKFRIHFNFPGQAVPEHEDHGYGPLATVVESFMDPGTLIQMHQHRNEEIISWVPAGVMRHDDRHGNNLNRKHISR